MSTLVIPDIHEKHAKARRILDRYESEVDLTVFLGDFYDAFGSLNLYNVKETAKLQKESINHPKRRVLMGNHDIPYAFKHIHSLKCSGHNPFKYETIDSIMSPASWGNCQYFIFVNNWLISHAGVHNWYLENKNPIPTLEGMIEDCKDQLFQGQTHFIVEAGAARGGRQKFGGITWLDFEREFQPVQNLNQIVGHTQNSMVRMNHSESMNSKNYCIDTNLNNIAIINDNGSVSIIDVSEL